MMNSRRFPVGLEEGAEGAVLVHSLTLPGCVAGGDTRDDALSLFPRVLSQWLDTLSGFGEPVPDPDDELEVVVEEWVQSNAAVGAGESEVFFEADEAPFPREERMHHLQRLGNLRGRLLAHLRGVPDEALDAIWRAEWTARLALEELARAHWFTLSRLGASSMAEVPDRTLARLDTSMALVVQRITEMPDEAQDRILELDGELWNPRKVLRRLLWLEWTFGRVAMAATLHSPTTPPS